MFLDPIRGRSRRIVVAAAAAVLATGACNDPEQNTDLRPAGPPEVLAVLVATDAVSFLYESATYCAVGDAKRPTRVGLPDFTLQQICDDEVSVPASMVTDAYPDGWYVRIMFDELLDPNIEELTEILDPDTGEGTDTFSGSIAGTQPVKLECESVGGGFVEVPYDGFYNPAGNTVTWPLGPSLVIKPNDPREVATGRMCRITINENVTDKSGEPVPANQRGPYPFKVAPITPLVIDPADEAEVDAFAVYFDNAYVQWNTVVDIDSACPDVDDPAADAGAGLCDDETVFKFSPTTEGICNIDGSACMVDADCTGAEGTRCDKNYAYTYDGTSLDDEMGFGPFGYVETGKEYTFSFVAGATLRDRCGVESTIPTPTAANMFATTFTTNAFDIKKIVPASGDTVSATRKVSIPFNNAIDDASLDATEYSLTPTPVGFVQTTQFEGDVFLGGHYALGTEYTFTLNAGATVEDKFGVVYTNPTAQVITFTTQPAVTVATSPANNATISKVLTVQPVGVTLTWNANMLLTSFTVDDFTFTDANGNAVAGLTIGTGSAAARATCTASSSACQFRVRGDLAPGDYIFTLKAGATIDGALPGVTYTQAADKVINFSVAAPPPAVQCL